MKEEQMPGPNERMKEIVRHYSDGNVKNFVTSLEDISHQTVNRIFNIDSRSGKYPGVSSDIIAAVAKAYPEIDINWLITGAGSMLRENTLVETNREKDLDSKTTQNILFILAETVKDQAATRREQMELMKTHGRILESIESKMARADAQTIAEKKLEEIAASLADSKEVDLLAAKYFEEKFVELAKLVVQGRSDKKPPSLGGDNRQGENDGGDHKPRKKRL